MTTTDIHMDAFKGPGRHDVLRTIEYFFGSPAHPDKLKDYTEHHAQVTDVTSTLWLVERQLHRFDPSADVPLPGRVHWFEYKVA